MTARVKMANFKQMLKEAKFIINSAKKDGNLLQFEFSGTMCTVMASDGIKLGVWRLPSLGETENFIMPYPKSFSFDEAENLEITYNPDNDFAEFGTTFTNQRFFVENSPRFRNWESQFDRCDKQRTVMYDRRQLIKVLQSMSDEYAVFCIGDAVQPTLIHDLLGNRRILMPMRLGKGEC